MTRGFTVLELLFVIGIITLSTALILPNYRAGERNLAFQRAAHKLAQDVRRTQDMAISAKEFGGVVPLGGYGIYFNISDPTHYILFADTDNGKDYDLNEKIEEVKIEKNIELSQLSPSSPLTIIFSPPDPTVVFSPDAPVASVSVRADSSRKTIEVNKAGAIFIKDQ